MGQSNTLEAAKGAVVLLAGFGALSLIHHDVQRIAEQLIGHLHLNPAKYYPHIFLDTAAHITDTRLQLMAILALCYALARFIESYGLWRERHWAEWFAAVCGGIYIPFEIFELFKKINTHILRMGDPHDDEHRKWLSPNPFSC